MGAPGSGLPPTSWHLCPLLPQLPSQLNLGKKVDISVISEGQISELPCPETDHWEDLTEKGTLVLNSENEGTSQCTCLAEKCKGPEADIQEPLTELWGRESPI